MNEAQVNDLLSKFSERAMNDTRYATKLAAQFVGRLYGGLSDESGKKRVYATNGSVTAYLRRLWSVSRLAGLSESGEKVRADHRQHAVDAIIVALTDDAIIKRLADAEDHTPQGRRFASVESPWSGFAGEVRSAIERLLVSHRPEKKLSGALHEETHYARLRSRDGQPFTATRKAVVSLSKPELDRIVDPIVRNQVKLAVAMAGGDPKRLNESNMPKMPSGVPIRHVRVAVRETPRVVGSAERLRHVSGGEIQHFEVFSVLDRVGNTTRWGYDPINKEKAVERARQKQPVICRDHGPNTRFGFTVAKTDVLEIERDGAHALMLVRGLESDGRVRLSHIEDARKLKLPDLFRCTVNQLMGTYKARKVEVTVLGDLIASNG
jgi:CRISPR-associated endonuclease Csn1